MSARRLEWACCTSEIGPKCQHRTTPEEDRAREEERRAREASR